MNFFKIILTTLLISLFPIKEVLSQNIESLFFELENELFPPNNNQKRYLHEFVKCTNHKIDSLITIRSVQPKSDKVLSLLEKIMHQQDTSYFTPILNLYNKHIKHFNSEWSKAYTDNYYACDIINEQYSILSGFETVLKSLYLKKEQLSDEEIFDFYIKESILIREILLQIPDRCSLVQKYKTFSTDYKELTPCSICQGSVGFHYLDPCFDSLETYFTNFLLESKWKKNKSESYNCMIIKSAGYFYNRIKDPQISNHFIENFSEWEKHNSDGYIYKYANSTDSPELRNFLAKKWINIKTNTDREKLRKNLLIGLFIKNNNENNFGAVIKEILNLSEDNLELALHQFDFLPINKSIAYLKNTNNLGRNKRKVLSNLKKMK